MLTDKSTRMAYKTARRSDTQTLYFCRGGDSVPSPHESPDTLWIYFLDHYSADDFVSTDVAKRFIQMGKTRARRYANYEGFKTYVTAGKKETDTEAVAHREREREGQEG